MSAATRSVGAGESGGVVRSSAVMAAGTAVSRILGVVRITILILAIGQNAGPADAFASANTLPNMLYMLVAGGVLNAVLVPQVVRAYRTPNGQQFVDRLLSLGFAIILGFAVLVTVAAPLIVRLSVGGQDAAYVALATTFAFWCLPQIFFYGTYSLLGQVLNARGSFGPYMWAPVVNNIVAIAGMVVFIAVFGRWEADGPSSTFEWWDSGKVALLAGTATLGVVAQAAVLIIPLYRSGFRFHPRRDWRGAGLGTAGRVAGWTFAALAAGQAGAFVVMKVTSGASQASGYDAAGYNAYSISFIVFMLPHSLVTVSLLTAMFTRLSGHAARGDSAAVRADFSYGLRTIGVFTVFATAVIAVLALPVARVISSGSPPEVVGSLPPVIVALMVGLVALGVWSMCQRVSYAHEDARSLFWVQVVMAGVVIVGSVTAGWVLPPEHRAAGAGAAISASYLVGAVWGVLQVRSRLGGSAARITRVHVLAGLAAAGSAAVGWPVSRLFGDLSRVGPLTAVLVCALVGLLMLGIYLGLLRLLRVTEVSDLLEPLLRRVSRSMGRPSPQGRRPKDARRGAAAGHGGDLLDAVVDRGTLLAGRYRLEERQPSDLPGVSMWAARDQILDRPVRALVLHEGRVSQAQDAARRAALVTDLRLLRVLDVGEHAGVLYTVTEPIRGRHLGELTAQRPLSPEHARSVVGEAAVALEVARRRGVHHLALRPSAVHVTPEGRVVVSGLAMDGELAGHGLGDARSTTRADTVGLVSLLYLCLTGRWPVPQGADPGSVPPAPRLDGAVVPPAELVPGVPNDLDTLCAVTLGPHDDGPHSPAELVRELEPWGDLDVEALFSAASGTSGPGGPAPAPAVVTGAASLGAPAAEIAGDTRPSVQRQSIRGASAGTTTPPGTPPPAIPPSFAPADPRTGAARVRPVSAAVGAAGAATASVGAAEGGAPGQAAAQAPSGALPPVIPPRQAPRPGTTPAAGPGGGPGAGPGAGGAHGAADAAPATAAPTPAGSFRAGSAAAGARPVEPAPAGAARAGAAPVAASALTSAPGGGPRPPTLRPTSSDDSFDTLIGRPVEVLTTRRFDPTRLVLALVAVALVVGLALAWRALWAPVPPFGSGTAVDLTAEPAEPTTEPDAAAPPPAEEPAPAPAAPPSIASAQMVDPPPGGDENEHPEAVALAIDGDPTTFWYTRTYKSPTFGMKPGVGYAITLAAPATVTTVTLQVNGAGGMVEVRSTAAGTPTEGEVLASGPLGPQTVLTLSAPTETQSIVLWFPALPQTADGSNRLELTEVSLS